MKVSEFRALYESDRAAWARGVAKWLPICGIVHPISHETALLGRFPDEADIAFGRLWRALPRDANTAWVLRQLPRYRCAEEGVPDQYAVGDTGGQWESDPGPAFAPSPVLACAIALGLATGKLEEDAK